MNKKKIPIQSVHITIKIAISDPAHGPVYSIKHYVINFVSDLSQVCGCLCVSGFILLLNSLPRYNWHIIESVAKHHHPHPCIE